MSETYIRRCMRPGCDRPLTGKQRKFCCRRCKEIERDRRMRSARRFVRRYSEIEYLLMWCAAMVAAYGDPREIGTVQWLENRSQVQK